MKYNRFGYLIGEGFSNVFKNKKSTGASLIIMCATMIIFGIFLVLSQNINHFVDGIKSEQGFQVFIKTDATQEEIDEIGDKIRAIDGVSTAEFKDKEYALNFIKEKFGDKAYMVEGYGSDYYPTSYIVKLTDLSKSEEIQNEISQFPNVYRITSNNNVASTLLNLAKVHARRKEISIMKYVGATNSFIRWPFVVEGIIIGVLASIISIIIVGVAYDIVAQQLVNEPFMKTIGLSLLSFNDMISSIIFVYMLLGIGIGALGSVISMRKYLKV